MATPASTRISSRKKSVQGPSPRVEITPPQVCLRCAARRGTRPEVPRAGTHTSLLFSALYLKCPCYGELYIVLSSACLTYHVLCRAGAGATAASSSSAPALIPQDEMMGAELDGLFVPQGSWNITAMRHLTSPHLPSPLAMTPVSGLECTERPAARTSGTLPRRLACAAGASAIVGRAEAQSVRLSRLCDGRDSGVEHERVQGPAKWAFE